MTLAFMIAHPDRVERAVLMGAAGLSFPITEALDYVWGYTPSFEGMKRSVQYLANDQSRLTDDLVKSRYEASIRPGVIEAYSAMFGETPRQKHITMLASDPAQIAALRADLEDASGAAHRVADAQRHDRRHQVGRGADHPA